MLPIYIQLVFHVINKYSIIDRCENFIIRTTVLFYKTLSFNDSLKDFHTIKFSRHKSLIYNFCSKAFIINPFVPLKSLIYLKSFKTVKTVCETALLVLFQRGCHNTHHNIHSRRYVKFLLYLKYIIKNNKAGTPRKAKNPLLLLFSIWLSIVF